MLQRFLIVVLLAIVSLLTASADLRACTGITLKAQDGAVVCGRTMEWGSFDLQARLVVIPRGGKFTSVMPDGNPQANYHSETLLAIQMSSGCEKRRESVMIEQEYIVPAGDNP